MVVYRERCNSEPETVSVPVFNMKTATPRQQVPYIAQRVTALPVPIFEAATGIFFFKSSTSKSSMFTLKLLTNNRWKFIFFSFQFIFVILDIPFVSFVTTYYALIDRKGNMTGKHVCPP